MDPDAWFSQPSHVMLDEALALLIGERWRGSILVGFSGAKGLINQLQQSMRDGHQGGH